MIGNIGFQSAVNFEAGINRVMDWRIIRIRILPYCVKSSEIPPTGLRNRYNHIPAIIFTGMCIARVSCYSHRGATRTAARSASKFATFSTAERLLGRGHNCATKDKVPFAVTDLVLHPS